MKAIYKICSTIALSSMLALSTAAIAQDESPDQNQDQSQDQQTQGTPQHQAPEPATMLLLGAGLTAVGFARKLRKNG
ncbi:MAG: PEP-CTERM sorting domain-containing protein [Deltaproteobacteria bacterium]|nr:PEP-CTERM sorting domain-containing protein [Deltaproteobacteria bacterium]